MYAGRKGVACQEACGTMDQLEILKRGALYEMVTGCRNEEAFICLSQEVKGKKKSLTDAKALFCMQDKLNAIYLCSGGLEHKSRAGSTRCSEQSSSENRFTGCDWWVRTGPREN